ncbi:MAG TPA: hypothetical protein VJ943_04940 [Desulfotignum sp.]|nr:hypothetical protein [Desulfotignum sp.]
MNCNDFFNWLRNPSQNKHLQDLDILAHIQECDDCRQLYDMDTCFEACIQQSFSLQKLPAGLAKKIDQHIDAAFFSQTEPFPRASSVDHPAVFPPVNGQSRYKPDKK